ncbi:TetR family transcriptional regulator [Streptomyces sp. SID5914]|nr:TetR/AcrR family transcriptional regulator [Streptomyces sp. SID5914]MZG13468.1 TetR family transcriptional regulator [Streptomyces sp. SID5914]
MAEYATVRRGRITPQREAELYEAVLDLLREVGYDGLRMDAVATRTRCSKATLYRQWGGKAELVARAMRHHKRRVDPVDTGSLRDDLHALMARQDDTSMERDSALIRALAMAVHGDPELLSAFREQLVEPELEDVRAVLRRAVERGEVRADNPALPHVFHAILGAITARALIDELPPTQKFLLSYIDAVILPALGMPGV